MTGTFSKPMPTGNETLIQSTGKRFALPMATVGHWTNGTLGHEWLFCDSNMKQLGPAQHVAQLAAGGRAGEPAVLSRDEVYLTHVARHSDTGDTATLATQRHSDTATQRHW